MSAEVTPEENEKNGAMESSSHEEQSLHNNNDSDKQLVAEGIGLVKSQGKA